MKSPKTLAGQDLDLADTSVCELTHDASHEPIREKHEPTCEPIDEPDRPWTLQAVADRLSCTVRNVQTMIATVSDAGPHLVLKTKAGRRTYLTDQCVALLDSLKAAREQGVDTATWIASQPQFAAAPPQPTVSTPTPSIASKSSALATVGVVPGSIQLATDDQTSMLDGAIARLTPATVELNGQQEENLSGIETLLGVVDQATALNDQKQAELGQRAATVEKTEQVIELVRDRLQTEQKRAKKLDQVAADISEREQQVGDLLGKLGISQS